MTNAFDPFVAYSYFHTQNKHDSNCVLQRINCAAVDHAKPKEERSSATAKRR